MTGNDILKQAMTLLNYTDNNGNVNAGNNANLNKRALPIINQIYADLWEPVENCAEFAVLTNMNEPIDLNRYALLNVMPYGVAMLLAQSDGDAENQTMYASLYNQRRAGAFRQSGHVLDTMPRTFM